MADEMFEGPSNPAENEAIIGDMQARAEQRKKDSAAAGRRRAGGGKAGIGANAKPSGEKVDIPNLKPKFQPTTVQDVIGKLVSRGGYTGMFSHLGESNLPEYGGQTLTGSQRTTLFKKFEGLSDEEIQIAHRQLGVFRPWSKNAAEENALFKGLIRSRKRVATSTVKTASKRAIAKEAVQTSGAQESFEQQVGQQPGIRTDEDILREKTSGSSWLDSSYLNRGFSPDVAHAQKDYGNTVAQMHDQLAHLAGMGEADVQPNVGPTSASEISHHLRMALKHLGSHYLDYAAGVDYPAESRDIAGNIRPGRGQSPEVDFTGGRVGSVGHLEQATSHLTDAAKLLENASPEIKKANVAAMVSNLGQKAVEGLRSDLANPAGNPPAGSKFGRDGEIYPTHIFGEPFPEHIDTPSNSLADAMVHQARNNEFLDTINKQRELEGGELGTPSARPSRHDMLRKLSQALDPIAERNAAMRSLVNSDAHQTTADEFAAAGKATHVNVPVSLHNMVNDSRKLYSPVTENPSPEIPRIGGEVSGYHKILGSVLEADATEVGPDGRRQLNKERLANNLQAIYSPESGAKLQLASKVKLRSKSKTSEPTVAIPTEEYSNEVVRKTNEGTKGYTSDAGNYGERGEGIAYGSYVNDPDKHPNAFLGKDPYIYPRPSIPDNYNNNESRFNTDSTRIRQLGLHAAEQTYREGMTHEEHMTAANRWLRLRGITSIDLRKENWDRPVGSRTVSSEPTTGTWSEIPGREDTEIRPVPERAPLPPSRPAPKSTEAREFAPVSKFLEPGEAYFGSPQVQRQLKAYGSNDEIAATPVTNEEDVQSRINRLFKPRTRTGTMPANPVYTGIPLPSKKPSMSPGMIQTIQAKKKATKAQGTGK